MSGKGERKEIEAILEKLIVQGWRITRNGGHYKAFPPDKSKPMVTVQTTAGEGRGMRNLIAVLRRSGYRG